jgi:acyl carrier protein
LNDVRREPLTAVETALAGIWKKVLGISEIGVLDNFFDLGGHSLALLEVRAGIQETLGRQIPVTELFRHPTISALGHYISHGHADQDDIVAARRRASTQKEAMLTTAQSASHLRVAPRRLSP